MVFTGSTARRALALASITLSAGVAAGASATPARAGLGISCPNPTAQVFAPWSDYANYAYAPDGGVELGASGWKLAGTAGVAKGNESFAVHSKSDRYSLALPAGSSATTPAMCIGLLSGHMRFFLQNSGSASSRLRVQALYVGGTGAVLGVLDVGYLSAGAAWQPSPNVTMLGGLLPLLTQGVQFKFSPADSTGNWRIDDVYVDPLKHT
jgi:hypothetical protein